MMHRILTKQVWKDVESCELHHVQLSESYHKSYFHVFSFANTKNQGSWVTLVISHLGRPLRCDTRTASPPTGLARLRIPTRSRTTPLRPPWLPKMNLREALWFCCDHHDHLRKKEEFRGLAASAKQSAIQTEFHEESWFKFPRGHGFNFYQLFNWAPGRLRMSTWVSLADWSRRWRPRQARAMESQVPRSASWIQGLWDLRLSFWTGSSFQREMYIFSWWKRTFEMFPLQGALWKLLIQLLIWYCQAWMHIYLAWANLHEN